MNSLITAEGQERLDSLNAFGYASLTMGSDVATLIVRGISYRRTQTVTQFTTLVRKVDVMIEPLAGSGPVFEASTYVSNAW